MRRAGRELLRAEPVHVRQAHARAREPHLVRRPAPRSPCALARRLGARPRPRRRTLLPTRRRYCPDQTDFIPSWNKKVAFQVRTSPASPAPPPPRRPLRAGHSQSACAHVPTTVPPCPQVDSVTGFHCYPNLINCTNDPTNTCGAAQAGTVFRLARGAHASPQAALRVAAQPPPWDALPRWVWACSAHNRPPPPLRAATCSARRCRLAHGLAPTRTGSNPSTRGGSPPTARTGRTSRTRWIPLPGLSASPAQPPAASASSTPAPPPPAPPPRRRRCAAHRTKRTRFTALRGGPSCRRGWRGARRRGRRRGGRFWRGGRTQRCHRLRMLLLR